MSGQCEHCKEDLGVGVGFRCSGCRDATFCDRKCQKAGWPAHSVWCREIWAVNAAADKAPAKLTVDASGWNEAALRSVVCRVVHSGTLEDVELASAQFQLGLCYYHGVGGAAVDYPEAVRNFELVAAGPAPPKEVFHALASCYKKGQGVAADHFEAVRLWTRGAEAGDVQSQNMLGQVMSKGTCNLDDFEIDAVAGYGWYKRAADAGHPAAQNQVGLSLQTGYGVAKDVDEAIKWFRRAAVQGDADAMYNLGMSYFLGVGVLQSLDAGLTWHQRAKLAGNTRAAKRLHEFGALNATSAGRAAHAARLAKVEPFPPPRRWAATGTGGEVGTPLPTPADVRGLGTGALHTLLARLGAPPAPGVTEQGALVERALRALGGCWDVPERVSFGGAGGAWRPARPIRRVGG